ncbi:hypothetical protein [[Eubacterium] cellulosolvens]
MAKTYSCNQTGAIAALIALDVWSISSIATAVLLEQFPASTLTAISIMSIIGWILIPLYIKLVKSAFIVGIIISILSLIGFTMMPGTPPWYSFETPILSLSKIIVYLVALNIIYFSHKSYKELK